MRSSRLMPALLLAMTLFGCAPRDRTAARGSDADVLAAVRADLLRGYPRAAVGIVTEVLPRDRYAAVSDVPVEEFQLGETITFIDANQKRLTHGQVRRITSKELHVKYDPPPQGGRPPRVGDLALRFR